MHVAEVLMNHDGTGCQKISGYSGSRVLHVSHGWKTGSTEFASESDLSSARTKLYKILYIGIELRTTRIGQNRPTPNLKTFPCVSWPACNWFTDSVYLQPPSQGKHLCARAHTHKPTICYRTTGKIMQNIGRQYMLIKGPDNPTSQLLPIMSNKCCSGDGEGRKDKGGGGGKMVCDKVVCERWCGDKVVTACERWCVTKLCVMKDVCQSV